MRCSHYDGNVRCEKEAKFLLCAPDGERVPGGWCCQEHAAGPINEYRDKLGQEWCAVQIDENGDAIPLTPIFRGSETPARPVEHTPEPWHYKKSGFQISIGNKSTRHAYLEHDHTVAIIHGNSLHDEANARRIVSCVNACEGVNPKAVPDLLAALKIIAPWRMRDGSVCFCPAGRDEDEPKGKMPTMHTTACDMGRAAIAKAEGRA